MTRFSDFIRAPGSAGPPTREGIRALGFALQTDFPTILADYVRTDQAQSFPAAKKLQGRQNLGLGTISTQDANNVAITGGSVTGIADGGTGASSAPTARSNLGLGNVDNTSDANKPLSNAEVAALALKAPLASPALTGNPTAPTQTAGDSSTKLATTAFVAGAVAPITNNVVAWVNFDGTNGTIRASKNVSSVVRTAQGQYTINFASALADANYAIVAMVNQTAAGGSIPALLDSGVKSTTQVQLIDARVAGAVDRTNWNVVVTR